MKIAIVAPEVFPVPPVRGGAVETVIEEVSAQLHQHEVHILGIADPLLSSQETRGHRYYHRWQHRWWDRLLLSTWKLPFKQSGSRWYYWPYQGWIARRLKQLRPDVVWVHSRIQFVPAIRRAAPRARIILSLHNESNLHGDAVWNAQAIRAVDVITGCSRFLTEAITRQRPLCTEKATVLYNGVNPEIFAPRWVLHEERQQLRKTHGLSDDPVVLYVGRLVEAKGVHLLLEAFQRVITDGTKATLVVVGAHTFSDESKTHYIEQLRAAAAALGDRVRFVGHVSRETIHQYFVMGDVLAFPSVWQEPFGMVILEAQAAGLPVIAFDHGGPAEIIRHGANGFLVPKARGAEGLAEALTQCLSDSTMREIIGREARWTIEERFTWQAVASRFLALCEDGRLPHVTDAGKDTVEPRRIVMAESGSGYGGSAKYLSELLTTVDRHRYDVQVVAAAEGPFIAAIRQQGVPVALKPSWVFPWGGRSVETKRASVISRLRYAIGGLMQMILLAPVIARWLARRRIQLVHLNNELLTHVPLLIGAKLARCRVVCHLHGWRPLTITERGVSGLVDEFICISEAGAAFYRKQLSPRTIEAIPNGIRLNGHLHDLDACRRRQRAQWGISDSTRVVALIGRLVPWKGQDIFLRALAQTVQRHPQVIGVIVGQDPTPEQRYLQQLTSLAQALGIVSHVRFMPWQEEIWSVYAAADVVVHASTAPEPFGLVLIEAMASGKPVIATRAGGAVDIVTHEQTGLCVAPGDIHELSIAINRMVEDQSLAQRLAQQGRARIQTHFTIERNAAQVLAVYDHLLGNE